MGEPTMMTPLLQQLLREPNARVIDTAGLDAFVNRSTATVLLLTGDIGRRTEALDVAVVAREFLRSDRELELALVARESEADVMKRYGVLVLPALVLLRGTRAPELLTRIRDWPEYVAAFARLKAPESGAISSVALATGDFA
jgi:hypothetical protein